MDGETKSLLKALLSVSSRIAFNEEEVRLIVAPTKAQIKQIRAFNECDGRQTQAGIAKKLRLDAGNFSRTVKRWIDAGIVHRVEFDGEDCLLHVFPISESQPSAKRDSE